MISLGYGWTMTHAVTHRGLLNSLRHAEGILARGQAAALEDWLGALGALFPLFDDTPSLLERTQASMRTAAEEVRQEIQELAWSIFTHVRAGVERLLALDREGGELALARVGYSRQAMARLERIAR